MPSRGRAFQSQPKAEVMELGCRRGASTRTGVRRASEARFRYDRRPLKAQAADKQENRRDPSNRWQPRASPLPQGMLQPRHPSPLSSSSLSFNQMATPAAGERSCRLSSGTKHYRRIGTWRLNPVLVRSAIGYWGLAATDRDHQQGPQAPTGP